MTKKEKEERRKSSIKWLKKNIKHKDAIYTVLQNVSSSGMTRHIMCLIVKKKEIVNISWEVADALDYKMNKSGDAVVVGGCGMDMGFSLVYNLSSLFPFHYYNVKEEKRGETPSSDGTNCYGLNHRWL